jgi:hypothetical protein
MPTLLSLETNGANRANVESQVESSRRVRRIAAVEGSKFSA